LRLKEWLRWVLSGVRHSTRQELPRRFTEALQ
jgi:hypothetical protein